LLFHGLPIPVNKNLIFDDELELIIEEFFEDGEFDKPGLKRDRVAVVNASRGIVMLSLCPNES